MAREKESPYGQFPLWQIVALVSLYTAITGEHVGLPLHSLLDASTLPTDLYLHAISQMHSDLSRGVHNETQTHQPDRFLSQDYRFL